MTDKPVPKFAAGDRVAWSHPVATPHARGSVLRESVVLALDPTARLGHIVEVANAEQTWFRVQFDGADGALVLTADELVKVSKE